MSEILTGFDVGDEIRITGTYVNDSGQAADPSTVTTTVRKPNGRRVSLATGRVSEGIWEALVTIDQPGDWGVRVVGSGVVTGAAEVVVRVRRSSVL